MFEVLADLQADSIDSISGLNTNEPVHPSLTSLNPFLGNSKTPALGLVDNFSDLNINSLTDISLIYPVEEAGCLVEDQLTRFATQPEFYDQFGLAFGENYNQEIAESIRQSLAQGDFSQLPKVEIISSDILGNANGAYANSVQTIFLSDQFVKTHNIEEIAGVLTEEIGHYIDSQINRFDAAGDEGDIFSHLVQGKLLPDEKLALLKLEDDSGVITVGGQNILIEKSQSSDLNGDRRDDLVLRAPDGNIDGWLLNSQGKATSPHRIGFADNSWSVVGIGDLNGDGRDDLVLRAPDGNIDGWLLNSQGKATSPHRIGFADNSWSVVGIGDLNGDGRDDLVLRAPDGNIDGWLLNSQGKATSPHRIGFADNSWSVVGIGDLNGDGRDDLVLRAPDGNIDGWLLNSQGKATSPHRIGFADNSWSVVGIGDLNGDGRDDLVLRAPDGNIDGWLLNSQGKATSPHRIGFADNSWSVVGESGYYRELSSLTDNDWNYQSRDNLFFDGNLQNGESLASVKQIYSDLSNGIFGSYKVMTAGYKDTTNYDGIHYGIDMGSTAGNTVKTVIGGTATLIQNISGNYFIGIKGDDGNLWIYGHLKNYTNGIVGKRVEAGSIIGTVFDGASYQGYWMYPHTHLEVHKGHNYNQANSISPLQAYWKWRNR
ncbi:FG-GAP-like repeat-containing protein [Gloeothece verrucosa]|uniref:Peptidase M23 n=1 Tax=Gloeothece verrucosa (strain PCC 7822) TaxID=497965 RepID=E0U5E8_GLOV7|nr:FG-GAP-like repeat-containing protein [Gloeothece verrucosa]ADN13538.1 Peptidase M23 [Gloeothece verrucosa PCC 7822]